MPSRTSSIRIGAGRALEQLPPWLHAALVGVLLIGSWAVVFGAGGTRTAFPHVFYIPIVLAAIPFGLAGGLAAGTVAMLLCGPAMPIDTVTGEAQPMANWLIRGGFFVVVGGVTGLSTRVLRQTFRTGLAEQLRHELDLSSPTTDVADVGWRSRVDEALDLQSFHPVFQPIYALGDGKLVAVEALTRFHAEPPYTPDVWFHHAASVGRGTDLELSAVRAALEASQDLLGDVSLSFNASPELLSDDRLVQLLDQHPDHRLIAEVTEHVIIDDYHQLEQALVTLRRRGVRLAVDDAGAGFASLRHIVRLQPDFIKLDPSLTQNLRNDPVRRPLADCLLQFADRTGSRIIAEGIESPADVATWRDLGAHAAQGYLLGRPGLLPARPSIDLGGHGGWLVDRPDDLTAILLTVHAVSGGPRRTTPDRRITSSSRRRRHRGATTSERESTDSRPGRWWTSAAPPG